MLAGSICLLFYFPLNMNLWHTKRATAASHVGEQAGSVYRIALDCNLGRCWFGSAPGLSTHGILGVAASAEAAAEDHGLTFGDATRPAWALRKRAEID